jgi:hypothetical protein
MDFLKTVGDFFLSTWIWNVTFGWIHPIIAGIVLFFLLRFILHRKRFESFVISIIAQLFAFGMLAAKVVFGFVKLLGWQYEPLPAPQALEMMKVFMPSLSLGIMYAIFQSILFILCRLVWRYNLTGFLIMTWISNGMSVLICYALISMVEMWYYVS